MLQGIKELTAIQVPWIKLVSQAGKVSGQNREFILNGLMVQFEKKKLGNSCFSRSSSFCLFAHTVFTVNIESSTALQIFYKQCIKLCLLKIQLFLFGMEMKKICQITAATVAIWTWLITFLYQNDKYCLTKYLSWVHFSNRDLTSYIMYFWYHWT